MLQDWRVGEQGIKATLLTVIPGSEFDVEKKFSRKLKALKDKGNIGKYATFKLFGHYDILLFYECDDFKPDLLFEGSVPEIIGGNELVCFPWVKHTKGKAKKTTFDFKKLSRYPLIGLTFFKIKPRFLQRYGVALELALANKFAADKDCSVLGTLGWSEIIAISHGNEMNHLIKKILDEITGVWLQTKTREGTNLSKIALKTYSIIGARYDTIKSKSSLVKHFGKQELPEDSNVMLGVSCKPGDMKLLEGDLARIFNVSQPKSAIGAADLCISIGKENVRTWEDFISKLLNFREERSGHLISTSVGLLGKTSLESIDEELPSQKSYFPLSKKNIRKLRKLDVSLSHAVINGFYEFNTLIQNELVSDCLIDMVPFMHDLRKTIDREPSLVSLSDSFENRMKALRFGANQRMMGAYMAIESGEGRFSPFKGGIQRILCALECLPHFIMDMNEMDWKGFLTVGFDRKYYQKEAVLNIPVDKLFKPADSWGLFHEIGHLLVWLRPDLFNFEDPAIQTIIRDRVNIKNRKSEDYRGLIGLLIEVIADIFDFEKCFLGDFDFYLKTVREYLHRELDFHFVTKPKFDWKYEGIVASYLLRSYSVYMYNRLFLKRDLTLEKISYDDLQWTSGDFYSKIMAIPKVKLNISKSGESKLLTELPANFSKTVKPFLEIINTRMGSIEFPDYQKGREKLQSDKLSKSISRVLEGRIISPEELDDPALFILKLKYADDESRLSFKGNVAAIISLWMFCQQRYLLKFLPSQE